MTQKLNRNGQVYEFPDDASMEEINKFFNKSELSESVKKNIPDQYLKQKEESKKKMTMFGEMPEPDLKKMFSPESVNEAIESATWAIPGGGGSLKSAEAAYPYAKKGIQKGLQYISPKHISEELRGKFGEGTVSENIEQLGGKIKSQKELAMEEALSPKKEFMEEASGKSVTPYMEKGKSWLVPEKGKYLNEEGLTDYYSKKSSLLKAHGNYAKTRSVEDADKLLSELKSEIRETKPIYKKTGTQKEKLTALETNLENLKQDWSSFIETLPENARGKYNEFAKKWAINVVPYEEGSFIIRKLSKGDYKGILPESIDRVFSNPNPKKEVLKVIKDIGPDGWKNLVYNMISRFEPGNVKGMARAIQEGYRRGSPIISEEMNKLAKEALKRSTISELVKGSAGGAAGAMLGGPVGGAVGAVTPYLWANRDIISKALKSLRK